MRRWRTLNKRARRKHGIQAVRTRDLQRLLRALNDGTYEAVITAAFEGLVKSLEALSENLKRASERPVS